MGNVQFVFILIYFCGFYADIRIIGEVGLKTLQFKRVEIYGPGLCWCLKSNCLVAWRT